MCCETRNMETRPGMTWTSVTHLSRPSGVSHLNTHGNLGIHRAADNASLSVYQTVPPAFLLIHMLQENTWGSPDFS